MTIATKDSPAAMWRDPGIAADAMRRHAPRLSVVDDAPVRAPVERERASGFGGRSAALLDRVIARSSLVANDPVLDMRAFGWTAAMRADWQAVRDEAVRLAQVGEAWRPVALFERGAAVPETLARCPATRALVERVPGLDSAAFKILAPGAHQAIRKAASKALVACHLGLVVPRDGDVRMRIGDRVVRWAEGETLVFDDTYPHESWNEARGVLVVLSLAFARPLRQPGQWVANRVLR